MLHYWKYFSQRIFSGNVMICTSRFYALEPQICLKRNNYKSLNYLIHLFLHSCVYRCVCNIYYIYTYICRHHESWNLLQTGKNYIKWRNSRSWDVAQWQSLCLACTKFWVQFLAPQEKKKRDQTNMQTAKQNHSATPSTCLVVKLWNI